MGLLDAAVLGLDSPAEEPALKLSGNSLLAEGPSKPKAGRAEERADKENSPQPSVRSAVFTPMCASLC